MDWGEWPHRETDWLPVMSAATPGADAWLIQPPTTSLSSSSHSQRGERSSTQMPATTGVPRETLHPTGIPQPTGNENANMSQNHLTYPLLFRAATEVPRFHVQYRWWEDEAKTVLWTFDIREISLVIRFSLLSDTNLPRTVLQSRNASTIDTFLSNFLQPFELALLPTYSHVHKVEEILRRCQGPGPLPFNVSWSWFPAQARRESDPSVIVTEIEAESRLQFKEVPFEGWVRCALGYSAPEVDWFLLQHNVFYMMLSTYLQTYPGEINKYREVEKLLRTRSPFAHRAVLQCLNQFATDQPDEIPHPTGLGFEFITGPIQSLFRNRAPDLASILKVLSVLSIRFRRTYVQVAEMNWNRKFDTSVPFLDDLLSSISSRDLTRTLTRSDQADFSRVSREQVMRENDPMVESLNRKWHTLSAAVWECCTALPELVSYMQDCIEKLHSMRNYHSTTAMIDGLQTYALACQWTTTAVDLNQGTIVVVSLLPPCVSYLSDTTNNYMTYRQQMRVAPGIPFLYPHVLEYQRIGEAALNELSTTR